MHLEVISELICFNFRLFKQKPRNLYKLRRT